LQAIESKDLSYEVDKKKDSLRYLERARNSLRSMGPALNLEEYLRGAFHNTISIKRTKNTRPV
jgi:hypothetical protein